MRRSGRRRCRLHEATAFPGDVIVGDNDGVLVDPAHMAAEVAEKATSMTVYEDFVIDMVSQGRTIVGLHPMTDRKNQDELEPIVCVDR